MIETLKTIIRVFNMNRLFISYWLLDQHESCLYYKLPSLFFQNFAMSLCCFSTDKIDKNFIE